MALFSNRHYNVLAQIMSDVRYDLHGRGYDCSALNIAITRLADTLEQDNSAFNRARFLVAVCTPAPESVA
jgi:hypothetical protein